MKCEVNYPQERLGLMNLLSRSRMSACLCLMAISTIASAAVVVIPADPSTAQSVVIRLTNQYGSDASIVSATISRSGNQFTINQTVNVICALPNAPVLTSDFNVGALPEGAYQVLAQIQHIGFGPGCTPAAETQSGSFVVTGPVAVPTASWWAYLLIAAMLLASGAYGAEQTHRGRR